jgi:hypothetical protein
MEPNRRSTKKQNAAPDLESVKAAIGSLSHQLWVEKRDTLNPTEVEWLVDGRLMGQLDELSKNELLRVKRLLERTVTRTGKRYMTGSSV